MTQSNSISIPGYRVGRKLGQGGMATVYLAIQESFDREVALKIMSPFLNSDPSFTTRFVREARIVAQIHHASIVPVMDVGEHQTHHYLSMEYLPGGDLKHRIAQGKHGLPLALTSCMAIASALDVAHRKGFVHRDIKPENILFREDGTPVLTDFGIARAIDAGTSLTMAGMLVGTPNYMSPEQVKGQELDGRSDLYSLGIVFYETLTGSVPFRADSSMSLALKHLSDPLPPLPLEYAIYQPFMDRLTAKEREDRFASGAEVTRALRLISEMANTRAPAQIRPVGTSVAQATAVLAVPSPSQMSPMATLAGVADPESQRTLLTPQCSTQAAIAPKTVLLPSPESELAQARKAARAAVLRSAAAACRAAVGRILASVTRARAKTPVAKPPMVEPGSSSRKPAAATAGWVGRLIGNQRLARRVSWAAAAVASVAVGTGGYVFTRSDTSTSQASELRAGLRTTATGEESPVIVADAEQLSQTPETLEMLQRVAEEGESLRTLEAMVDQARSKEERELKAQRREEERKRKNEEAVIRKAELLRKNEELRLANEKRVQELLVEARKDYAENRLFEPAGSNAVDRYREVLKLDAAQAEALAGVRKIADMLVTEADRSLNVGRAVAADTLIDRVRVLQPQHPQLAMLTARLQAIQSSPVALASRQQSNLERSEKAIAKAYEYLNRKPLNLKAVDAATDQFDKAAKLAPEVPGLEMLKDRIIVSFSAATRTEMESNDPKDARKIVELARARNWFSEELERWDATLNAATAAKR